jgi:DNA-binding SARP family transcriptional activator
MPSLLERLREALEPRYEVEAEVASGGMATVFRARDTSLERVVAVKVLRPDLATATGEARFLREARVLASFSHPNMVSIHDAGEADGLFFYIMDFVEGDTLATRLEQGPLDAYGVLRMGRDLLAALQRIHEAGVVHRDVKPGNVFLVDGRTLLADFGVASVPASGDDVLTREGGGPGTPAYMAPEQIAGRSATLRSDVYATGMLLFEAFTGRRWQALTVPERADWNGVPIAARPVLCRALAVDPDDRWPDAASFGTALRVRGPVLRVPRWAAFLGGAAALVVLAVLAYSLGGSGGANIDPAGYDVAVFPCEAGNVADSSLAFMVGRLVALNLEDVPGISTAPKNEAARRFHGRSGDLTSDDWVGALGARHGLECDLLRTGDGLDVGWRVLGPAGELVREGMVSARGDSAGLALDAATELTLAVLRVFRVETVTPETAARLSDYPFAAVRALLHGEKALLRGAWPVAELHYRDALSIDSTFTLARWRLAEVHRWLAHDPIDEDLVRIFHMDAASLSPLDSLLLYARVQPPGPAKYAAYEDILSGTTYRRDAYATLLYADELYHRGGLWGVPLDSAIALFDLAVRRDSALVPAVEHLTQAMIRTGDREAAERLLPQLAAIHPSPAESDPYYPAMWSQGVLERFHPEQAKQGREDLLRAMCDTPECRVRLLTLITRWVRYLDLPATQHALGVELAATAEAAGDPSLVAAGSLARGTALVTLGQIGEANVAFDEAAQPGSRGSRPSRPGRAPCDSRPCSRTSVRIRPCAPAPRGRSPCTPGAAATTRLGMRGAETWIDWPEAKGGIGGPAVHALGALSGARRVVPGDRHARQRRGLVAVAREHRHRGHDPSVSRAGGRSGRGPRSARPPPHHRDDPRRGLRMPSGSRRRPPVDGAGSGPPGGARPRRGGAGGLPAVIHLRTLGPVEVSVDGTPAPRELMWRKNLALLLYLVRSADRRRSREHLVGVFWGDKPDSSARHSLNEALRVIRKAGGEDLLVSESDQVVLSEEIARVDVDLFEDRLASGDWQAAADLVRGTFLEGFTVPDSRLFEDWLATERLHWAERAGSALHGLAEARLARGDVRGGADAAARALGLDPFSDTAVRLIMLSYALQGERAGALAVYDGYAARLADELGIEPDPNTEALAERVRSEREWQLPAGVTEAERWARRIPLVGREVELETTWGTVRSAFDENTAALLVVRGDSGSGKTRLGEEIAARARLEGATVAHIRAVPSDRDVAFSGLSALSRGGLLTARGAVRASPGALAFALAGTTAPDERLARLAQDTEPAAPGEALTDLVRAAAALGPVFLWVDGAGHLDPESAGSLRALLRDVADVPCALLLTASSSPPRDELDDLSSRVGLDLPGAILTLGSLDPAGLRELVDHVLPDLDDEAAKRLGRGAPASGAARTRAGGGRRSVAPSVPNDGTVVPGRPSRFRGGCHPRRLPSPRPTRADRPGRGLGAR